MNRIEMLGRKALAFGCGVAYEEPMNRHTTFKIGGPAELFVTAHNAAMLSDFLREAEGTGRARHDGWKRFQPAGERRRNSRRGDPVGRRIL